MHEHGPLPPDVRETVDLWISDFLDRPAGQEVSRTTHGYAQEILLAFLDGACHGGTAPADLEPAEVSHALLDHLPHLEIPASVKQDVPTVVAAFLEDLETVGRLAGGSGMAQRVRAAQPAFRARMAGRGPDLTRPGAKLGRNDPCPCGSGQKYKRCCMNREL